MDKFVVNIIHRPEMVPEYAEKVTGHGKEEDIGRKSLLTESLDIFRFQQETAHKNGLKTTIQMTYASLFNDEAIQIAKEDHEKYGDEISLSLLGLPCTEFREKYKTKDFCIWMFSMEDKKSIVDDVFGKFHDIFGFYPESTGSYYLDAELINYIKEKYPSVKCAIATCWEEGTERPIIRAIIPGIRCLTAARGIRGFHRNRIRTPRPPMRRRTAELSRSRIFPVTCWHVMTETDRISGLIRRTCSAE